MSTRVSYHVGTGFNSHGNQLTDLDARFKSARMGLAGLFGGFTEVSGTGGWIDGKGILVLEPSTTYAVYTDDLAAVDIAAELLRVTFDQSSVLVARDTVTMAFHEAKPIAA